MVQVGELVSALLGGEQFRGPQGRIECEVERRSLQGGSHSAVWLPPPHMSVSAPIVWSFGRGRGVRTEDDEAGLGRGRPYVGERVLVHGGYCRSTRVSRSA